LPEFATRFSGFPSGQDRTEFPEKWRSEFLELTSLPTLQFFADQLVFIEDEAANVVVLASGVQIRLGCDGVPDLCGAFGKSLDSTP
jgi:hypothetical protein